jgi:L-aspartate oxidase
VLGRLRAPDPGWPVSADMVVTGSGIAGLTAALRLRGRVGEVLDLGPDLG